MTKSNFIRKEYNIKLGANIAIGGGYSSDSQQVTPQSCFNATGKGSGQQAVIQLSIAQSFSDLQKQMNIDVSTKVGFGMFSATAEASYMRSMEDKDYSLSLNYYNYMFDTVSIDLAGGGIAAINSQWQSLYDNGNNPFFGLECGDNYISSYQQGAMLVMGISINFNSHLAKQQFRASAGTSFGDMFSASASIQKVASQYNMEGSVSMQAYQIGGDPSRLANILSKDSNGDYYALTCNIQSMDDCTKVADGLLNYAQNDFANQISFANNTGLTPLGQGFMKYTPIAYVGLTPPPSFVNQTVINDRVFLAQSLLENQYYEQKFNELLNGYPVTWDTTSNIYQTSQKLYQQAQNNIDALVSPGNPDNGGLGCYDMPFQCNSITQNINASLVPIAASDLNFFGQTQYIYNAGGDFGQFYFDGTGYNILPFPAYSNGDVFSGLVSATITDNSFSVVVHYYGGGDKNNIWTKCATDSSTDGVAYLGQSTCNPGASCGSNGIEQDYVIKITSPFYFQAYNGTNPDLSIIGEEASGLHDINT